MPSAYFNSLATNACLLEHRCVSVLRPVQIGAKAISRPLLWFFRMPLLILVLNHHALCELCSLLHPWHRLFVCITYILVSSLNHIA